LSLQNIAQYTQLELTKWSDSPLTSNHSFVVVPQEMMLSSDDDGGNNNNNVIDYHITQFNQWIGPFRIDGKSFGNQHLYLIQ
jgi:hypothetical protein